MSLFENLSEYSKSNPARFHMPGHKGNMQGFNPYSIDVTEVLDFDDLHNPGGHILNINERLKEYYNVSIARLLVNGTTSGIMASIFAMINEGDKVLITRSSHKSVYNALVLKKATPIFIEQKSDEYGILIPIEVENIKKKIHKNPDIKLCILTYPTYEGVFYNIKDVICLLKESNISVLVDAAHGAHLEKKEFIQADISVTSLHKTLPFLTQTSSLLISKSGEKYKEKVDYYLSCFESSSPSYVLMAAADRGLSLIERDGEILFKQYSNVLTEFYKKTERLKNICVLQNDSRDPSKIIIVCNKNNGLELINAKLLENGVIPEMTTCGYILCMASIMNTKDDLDRLFAVLAKMDIELAGEDNKKPEIPEIIETRMEMPMYKAIENNSGKINFWESENEISAGFVEMFPPGIPILVPGELIEKKHIELVKKAKENNINIRGLKDDMISVV